MKDVDMDAEHKLDDQENIEEKILNKKDIYELIFKKTKQFIHHVHTSEIVTPFYQTLRDFMNEYPAVPSVEDGPHIKLVNYMPLFFIGNTGYWHESNWRNIPLLTKTQRRYELDTLKELFINYVILNQYESKHIIPTYGFFWHGHNHDGSMLDWYGEKRFCLVQVKINGFNLSQIKLDVPLLKRFIKEIGTTLDQLEKTTYRLIHGNLCPKNIIIVQEDNEYHAVVVGFEMASFTFFEDGIEHRIRSNAFEVEYSKNYIIYSGARDMICLFTYFSCHPNPDIADFGFYMAKKIYDSFWKDVDTPFDITKEWLHECYQRRWIYQTLLEVEEALEVEKRDAVHNHNMEQFHAITYLWVLIQLYRI